MASLNKVYLIGNLTRDPDLRGTPGGYSVCTLGLAVNRRYTVNGQEKEESVFVDVEVWGKTAEVCHRNLAKGSSVMIEGRLKLDHWEDRNGGGKRSKLAVVGENVQFLSRKEQAPQTQQSRGIDPGYAPASQDDIPW